MVLPLNKHHIYKSAIIATACALLSLVLDRLIMLPTSFLLVYVVLVLEDKASKYFQLKKKTKDPASMKLKDKINFYESFNELDHTQQKSPVTKRRSEAFYKGYTKNNIHKRTHSQNEIPDYSPPPMRRTHVEKKDMDENFEGETSPLLSVLQMEHPALEKHNSFLDTKNELTDLAREKKVKSTLVLLKKQHPSFVEGMWLARCNTIFIVCRAPRLDSEGAHRIANSKIGKYAHLLNYNCN